MLDNFGFGEFFFLALLALLFFGPDRLPRIGAQIGRWIRNMSQYSSAFMTEWRDEALAVYDAVEEVKGIRDELAAARADIAGTLHTAQEDIDGALSGARLDVQQQIENVKSATAPSAQPPTPAETKAPAKAGPGEKAAVAKTQNILGDLLEKRAKAEPEPQRTPADTPHKPEPAAPASPPHPTHATTAKHRSPVRPADMEALRTRVTTLQDEMYALRGELAQYRARIWSQSIAAEVDKQRGKERPSTAPPAGTAPAETAPAGGPA